MPEENVNAEQTGTEEVTTGADQTPAETEQKSETATEFLNRSVEEIKSKAEQEPTGEETADEKKPAETSEDTEEIDETEMLRRAGFTQKSLEDVKTDLNREANKTEIFNWLNKNVEGFGDFVYQKMLEARGVKADKSAININELGAKKPGTAVTPNERKTLVEKFGEDQVSEFEEIMAGLGYAKKDDLTTGLKSYEETQKAEAAQKTAIDTFKNFGKQENVSNILKGLNMTWDDVKKPVTDILLEDFGIADFSNVTEKNIARAFNAYVQEQDGGIEKLLTNAKNEALKTHEDKLKLGKPVPKPGTETTGSTKVPLEQWLNGATPQQIKERMNAIARKGR